MIFRRAADKGPAGGLGRDVGELDIDDLELAVRVFGAHDSDNAARHEVYRLENIADKEDAARVVFEHDLVLALVGVVALRGEGCGDPALWENGLLVRIQHVYLSSQGPVRRHLETHIFGNILKDVWLQRHVHVDGASDPAELALADVEDSVNMPGLLAANYRTVPGLGGDCIDGGPDGGQAQEVDIRILLLVRAFLGEDEGAERFVVRRGADEFCRGCGCVTAGKGWSC